MHPAAQEIHPRHSEPEGFTLPETQARRQHDRQPVPRRDGIANADDRCRGHRFQDPLVLGWEPDPGAGIRLYHLGVGVECVLHHRPQDRVDGLHGGRRDLG